MFDYFYGGQAGLFSFYRIPKALFTDARIRGISAESKILYGLLLDRMGLSVKNGWTDDTGRVYIIFTTEEIMEALYCADNKATKLMKELESCGLIERKRPVKTAALESLKSRGTNTNPINTDSIETDPFLSGETGEGAGTESEGKDDRTQYQEYFVQQLNFDVLIASHPDDEDMLRELLELLVDTVCSKRRLIRIAGDDKPAEVVKAQLMKLNSDHLRFVLMCLKENTSQVRNIRQYLLATLYNAPMTMSNYYTARVQHDFKTG